MMSRATRLKMMNDALTPSFPVTKLPAGPPPEEQTVHVNEDADLLALHELDEGNIRSITEDEAWLLEDQPAATWLAEVQ